jgi:SAM-dependent methyltransferase
MADWASGYVVDIEYTHGFYRELAPSFLGFIALMQRVQAPGLGTEPAAYCELGCGQGISVNLLAAANPHIQFYATDFNPAHIAGAEALAQAARLGNVHFSDDSFAEFLERDDLPDFDFVTLHGIYSWISAENRQNIIQFIRRKLKPGGVVYASYNTMPGWTSVMPLRRLMVEYAARQSAGSRASRIRNSLDFAERLSKVGARYFASHPKLAERLTQIRNKNPNYVAHEYFNADLNPFYFMDVASEFEEAKLRWIGSAAPLDAVEELNLSEEQRKILAGIDGIPLRETVRDHLIDQGFRKDIFVKGPVRLSPSLVREHWLDTRFALSRPGQEISPRIQGRGYSLTLEPDFHRALTAALDHHPRTVREITASPDLAKHSVDKVTQALAYLIGQGTCHPCLAEDGLPERLSRAEAFNMAVATQALHGQSYDTFASPVTGSGIRVEQIDQLIFLALRRGEANVPEFVWRSMNGIGQRLAKGGKTLTQEEHQTELKARVIEFETKTVPILRSLGIATHLHPGEIRDRRMSA